MDFTLADILRSLASGLGLTLLLSLAAFLFGALGVHLLRVQISACWRAATSSCSRAPRC